MEVLYLLVFAFSYTEVLGDPNGYTYACDKPLTTASLPDNLIPVNYSAVIRFVDVSTSISALFNEIKSHEQHWLKRVTRNGTKNFGFGALNVTFNETTCAGFSNVASIEPLYFMDSLSTRVLNFHGFSISQLIEVIRTRNFSQKGLAENVIDFGGMQAVKWIGCDKVTEGNSSLQVEVIFTGPTSTIQPYASTLKNPILLAVHVVLFERGVNETTHVLNSTIFEVVELEVPSRFENPMPAGMHCSNMPPQKLPATFPPKFEASFSYRHGGDSLLHFLNVYYDNAERVVVFETNPSEIGLIPFFGNFTTYMKEHGHTAVIHDFTYGLEYALDGVTDVCLAVSGINPESGDVRLVSANSSEIELKSSDELFLSLAQSSFYFAGQRRLNDVMLNVYTSETNEDEVIELLFFTEKMDASKNGFLHSILRYKKDTAGKVSFLTTITLDAFHNLTGSPIHDTHVSVQSCLSFDVNSSFYVVLKKVHLSDIVSTGLSRVKVALRRKIAELADVSSFRISDIFFKESGENVLAFFSVSNSLNKATTATKDMKNETSFEEAVGKLNATLSKEDIKFEVEKPEKAFYITQSTLRVLPDNLGPLPTPSPTSKGYSGSSMFILAIFMLLLGAAVGVGIVLFLWKRQRIGSFAYQVFE